MRFSDYPWAPKDMVGGNAALDFVNTVSRWESGDPADQLGSAQGFGKWAQAAGLLDDADMARLQKEIGANPKGAKNFYTLVVDLRGALWRIFSAIARDEKVSEEDLALLDDCKARSAAHCRIVPDGKGGFRKRCRDEAPALDRALRLIVEAAEDMLLNGKLDRLHICGGDQCEWMFIDLSKNGRRRWCSMSTCGNDMKVKKFRKRKKKNAA